MDLGVDIAELLLVFSNYFANQTDDKDARAVGITLTVLPVGIKAGYHTLHLDSTYGKVSAGVSATLFVLMMFRMAPK
jgi:hypothetical protein